MRPTNPCVAVISIAGVLIVVGLAMEPPGSTIGYAAGNESVLAGRITSASGEKMEGVTVSTRAEGSPVTISVYTDAQGEYYFPPVDAGKYNVWAQSQSYEAGRAELNLSGSAKRQDFVLKPTKNF